MRWSQLSRCSILPGMSALEQKNSSITWNAENISCIEEAQL